MAHSNGQGASGGAAVEAAQQPPQLEELVKASIKRTHDIFIANFGLPAPVDPPSQRIKLASKIVDEWEQVKDLPKAVVEESKATATRAAAAGASQAKAKGAGISEASDTAVQDLIEAVTTNQDQRKGANGASGALTLRSQSKPISQTYPAESASALVRIREPRKVPKPKWHAPWKLMRVIAGHLGWVRSVAVEPGNEWFATGAGDRVIKIWDLASGTLKLTLTGHISAVRGLAVSPRHPYLFSAGEDKMVKCWDLEYNKVIRHYHGHLSGVYTLDLHPTLDIMVTGGRDSCARVWDMRTKAQIFGLTGHESTVSDVKCQEADPQIISASMDSTVRLWDLAAGKTMTTLTHHKKAVRALAVNPSEFTFASASPDNIKQWKCPEGQFMQNLEGHNAIVNTMACNRDGVLFSGGDNGSMYFWDYKTGYNFQTAESLVQPGSLESEAGIFCSTFDKTGSRLITGEADKTIKIWKEDENATPETHPVNWKPKLGRGGF
ncbi:WD40-repeat-containing domain protein [Fimicolochytrium jonesii]|uniref:WD40-repeat-containing domain protein n=1 Tax=Fimicolochytrium jonesii TaxID=1396493 RepID=UPI0022FE0C36|nr:WD40-repeat-containing domain protein [Fimicolochytrium jonesii]KAI8825983.1 WD40-repeat-containing domain protein [Fimicolochytrium jonesii]